MVIDMKNPLRIIKKDIKHMYLSVHPDCSVVLKAPKNTTDEYINSYLKKKEQWIQKQVDRFKQHKEHTKDTEKQKEFVSGECFMHLGKQYRLKIYEFEFEGVKLNANYINVFVKNKNNTQKKKRLLESWYRENAFQTFSEIMDENYKKVTKNKPELAIRKMKTRWGSCSHNKNKIILNPKLIEKPRYCIEYVVVHELAHLKHPNHSKNYYNYLTYLMPDWEWRRDKLNNGY
jgi:predicted metal-dependent hydrolase